MRILSILINFQERLEKKISTLQRDQSPTFLQVDLGRLRLHRKKHFNVPALRTHRFQPTNLPGIEPYKQPHEKPTT